MRVYVWVLFCKYKSVCTYVSEDTTCMLVPCYMDNYAAMHKCECDIVCMCMHSLE